MFRAGGRYLDSDAVCGVRSTLVADWVRRSDGEPGHRLDYDFGLNPVVQ